jgi:hypothetical protein
MDRMRSERTIGRMATTRAVIFVGTALLAASSISTGIAATGQSGASRVIDRTLRCTIYADAGLRQIALEAQPGTRDADSPSEWRIPPAIEAESYGLPSTIYGGLAALSSGGLRHNRTRCESVRTRVPLTPSGLSGGQASTFGDAFDCNAPQRVLVRVRAVFKEPVRLRLKSVDSTRRHKEMIALGSIQTGALAIRAEAGRPIAYADMSASGRVRLFTGANCFPD